MPACGLPSGLERATRFQRNVHELPVVLVLVQRAGGRVVGHVDVRPAIVVEVRSEHAQPVRSVGLSRIPALRDTSVNVPSPLLWYRMFLPPFRPGGPHATITPL